MHSATSWARRNLPGRVHHVWLRAATKLRLVHGGLRRCAWGAENARREATPLTASICGVASCGENPAMASRMGRALAADDRMRAFSGSRVVTHTVRIQSRLRSTISRSASETRNSITGMGPAKVKIDTKGRTLDASGAVADACAPRGLRHAACVALLYGCCFAPHQRLRSRLVVMRSLLLRAPKALATALTHLLVVSLTRASPPPVTPRSYMFLYTLLLFGALTIVSFGVTYFEVSSMAPHLVNVDASALEAAFAVRVRMCVLRAARPALRAMQANFHQRQQQSLRQDRVTLLTRVTIPSPPTFLPAGRTAGSQARL